MVRARPTAAVHRGADAGAVGAQGPVQRGGDVGHGDVIVATDVDHSEVPGTVAAVALQPGWVVNIKEEMRQKRSSTKWGPLDS